MKFTQIHGLDDGIRTRRPTSSTVRRMRITSPHPSPPGVWSPLISLGARCTSFCWHRGPPGLLLRWFCSGFQQMIIFQLTSTTDPASIGNTFELLLMIFTHKCTISFFQLRPWPQNPRDFSFFSADCRIVCIRDQQHSSIN